MTVVFIGPPAAGKSRAGKRLATRLGATFADTDKLFAREHGPVADFIRREGEEKFRELEREIVAAALRDYEVVSLGGGSILNDDTQRELSAEEHVVVLLVAQPSAIETRISGNNRRPLLSGIESWIATYERRRPIYESLANVRFDTSFRPMWRVVHEVHRYLEREQPGRIPGTTPKMRRHPRQTPKEQPHE